MEKRKHKAQYRSFSKYTRKNLISIVNKAFIAFWGQNYSYAICETKPNQTKPNRNRQTILRRRQFRIRTSLRILKVGLLRRGLFFSGNEWLRHSISRKIRRQMWSLFRMARGSLPEIPDAHGQFLSGYCRNLIKTAGLLNSLKQDAKILTSIWRL